MQGLIGSHAHNDYEHRRPLFDALDAGFMSVEADVYLVKGELWVAHDRKDLRSARTLRKLYLEPINAMILRNGFVYDGQEFTLMVDVKADGPEATRALIRELEPYRQWISTVIPRSVKVVVSGAGDRTIIESESYRLLNIDGRPGDLDQARNKSIAWVSDNWSNHFKWKGNGPMPEDERLKLVGMASKAHALRYQLRFWATPEQPVVWSELRAAGVDLIGSDQLTNLARFLSRR
ncbi:MAG: hypothetical protein ABL949_14945 [Fimbriimonadaceae bacterium]